jgi:hypothetical protein
MPRSSLMTQKALAEKIRVSPQYVNKLVQQGKIKRVGKLIDARQAKAAIAAFKRAGRVVPRLQRRPAAASKGLKPLGRAASGSKEASATQNLTANRARYEAARAQIAELELARLTKALLPAAEVLEAERRKNANIRSRFRRLARSLAPLLHRTTSPAEVEQLLLGYIDLELSELTRDPLGAEDAPPATPEPQAESQIPENQLPVVSGQWSVEPKTAGVE